MIMPARATLVRVYIENVRVCTCSEGMKERGTRARVYTFINYCTFNCITAEFE